MQNFGFNYISLICLYGNMLLNVILIKNIKLGLKYIFANRNLFYTCKFVPYCLKNNYFYKKKSWGHK